MQITIKEAARTNIDDISNFMALRSISTIGSETSNCLAMGVSAFLTGIWAIL